MAEKELILGIDDAGRGPVIGPMILAGCLFRKEDEAELKELGVADSKILFRKKRERMVKVIKKKAIAWATQKATPAEIDTGMGTGLNLNQVEALEAGLIINELTKGISKSERVHLRIVIDCPSSNPRGWTNQLMEYVDDKNLNISCEHKADRDHVVVAAASIVAKVKRDDEMEKLKKLIGVDCGSGYPADPKTKDFLKKHINDFKAERIFRESWSTFQSAKEAYKTKQAKLPDY